MKKVNLTKMFLLSKQNMNNFLKHTMCYGIDKKCGNDIQRISIFESTIVHNSDKGF
jgi:hypothetical protein